MDSGIVSSTAEFDMASFEPLSGFKTDLEKVVSLGFLL